LELAPRELTTAEAYHFIHMSGLWLFLALLGVVIVTASAFYGVMFTFAYLPIAGASFVSIGLAAYFVVLGLVLPRGEIVLAGEGTRRMILSGPPWRARTAMALTIAIVAGFVALLWRVGMTGYQSVLWIMILVLGGSLAVAASYGAATGRGLRAWSHWCADLLRSFVEAIIRVCWRLFLAIAYFLEVLSLALAAPIFILRGRELPSF
jgi:hypothetical protein